jgi:hypothetical protein
MKTIQKSTDSKRVGNMASKKIVIAKDWYTTGAQKRPELTRMVNLFEQAKVSKAEDLPQLLDARDLAKLLRLHYKTALQMMKEQSVRSVKLRGRRYTTPEWIADFMRKELRPNG